MSDLMVAVLTYYWVIGVCVTSYIWYKDEKKLTMSDVLFMMGIGWLIWPWYLPACLTLLAVDKWPRDIILAKVELDKEQLPHDRYTPGLGQHLLSLQEKYNEQSIAVLAQKEIIKRQAEIIQALDGQLQASTRVVEQLNSRLAKALAKLDKLPKKKTGARK